MTFNETGLRKVEVGYDKEEESASDEYIVVILLYACKSTWSCFGDYKNWLEIFTDI